MNEELQASNLESLVTLLAMLRGLKWGYWNFHWVSKGQNFYESHLLFERLYSEQIDEQIDTLAEKITFYNGDVLLESTLLTAFSLFVDQYATVRADFDSPMKELYHKGLRMEKQVQFAIETAYNNLKTSDQLSLGMDDYLMSLANQRETVIYLLRQQLR